jgi:hypothetical protein
VDEKELQRAVCDHLDALGVRWFHLPQGIGRKRRQVADLPDLLFFSKQFGVCFLELKAPGKPVKLSEGQQEFQAVCNHNGVYMWAANDIDKIKRWIDMLCLAKKY